MRPKHFFRLFPLTAAAAVHALDIFCEMTVLDSLIRDNTKNAVTLAMNWSTPMQLSINSKLAGRGCNSAISHSNFSRHTTKQAL